jgi:hypothetical protein
LAEGANRFRVAWLSAISTSSTFAVPDFSDNVLLRDDLVCLVTVELAWIMDVHRFVHKRTSSSQRCSSVNPVEK